MGGSAAGSKAKSSNSYKFGQKIPKFQEKALTALYGNAADLYGSSKDQINKAVPGATDFQNKVANASVPALQKNLNGGVYANLGIGNQLMQSLQQSQNTPSNMQTINNMIMGGAGNNYADAMKAQYLGDANRATDNMLANLDARAAASGMSGGSRHGIATAQGMYDINSNLQKNLAQTGYDTFSQDLDRKLNIASQADANTMNRQNLMASMLGQQQGTTDGAINQGQTVQNLGMGQFAPMMVPWDAMSNYANVIGSPTVLSSGSGGGNSKAMANSASGGK